MAGRGTLVAAAVLAGCLSFVDTACSAEPVIERSETAMSFDIPAQPLQSALESFMTMTTHSGLYDSAVTVGRYSSEVRGRMAPEAALRQMLAHSGLEVRYPTDDTFSLVPATTAAPIAAPMPRDSANDEKARYFDSLQASVESRLRKSPSTAPGSYRAALSLWVASTGSITKVRLLDTTGSSPRDARLSAALQGLQVLAPPPGNTIRQPITIVILPGTQECSE